MIEDTRFPPFGFDIAEISFNANENMSFFSSKKKICCPRILIEGTRFPPFGFAIAEISSNSNEDVSFC